MIYEYFIYVNWETFYIKNAHQTALISLYILHCTWTYKLLKIGYNSLFKSTFEDSRKFVKEKKA